ncbi:hypothetical protein CB1_000569026 [Camelus ferus]|nr:hypothetical protein CB1_000569026 [Camelus ferus]
MDPVEPEVTGVLQDRGINGQSSEAEQSGDEVGRISAGEEGQEAHLVANSSILLNIKPWDDELDRVQLDGLILGGRERQLVPMGHDIGNLQIAYVAEDDRLGTDLPEEITTSEEQVQSVNFPALNKS